MLGNGGKLGASIARHATPDGQDRRAPNSAPRQAHLGASYAPLGTGDGGGQPLLAPRATPLPVARKFNRNDR